MEKTETGKRNLENWFEWNVKADSRGNKIAVSNRSKKIEPTK